MKNSNKKKSIKRYLKFFTVVIVVLMIMTIVLIKINERNKEVSAKDEFVYDEKETEEYLSERILLRNINIVNANYKGNINKDLLYKRLNKLVNYFDTLSSELENKNSETNIQKFYKENDKEIKDIFGDILETDFEEFVKLILNKDVHSNEFHYAEVLTNGTISLDNYFVFKVKINYEHDKSVILDVYLSNIKNNDNSDIIFKYSKN